MHTNTLIVQALEADLQQTLRIAAAQRAIRSHRERRLRLPDLRPATRRTRLARTPPAVTGPPLGRTPR